jgi:acetate kinase
MEKKYLIVNIGSASKKYALYQEEKELCYAHFEKEGETYILDLRWSKEKNKKAISSDDFSKALDYFLNFLKEKSLINNNEEIGVVSARIVAPGTYFRSNRIIDEEYWTSLRGAENKAPLHLGPTLAELKIIEETFPKVLMFGISDSAFHKNLPEEALNYGLPRSDAKNLDIYRFGYHGISKESVLKKIKESFNGIPERVIIAHLGGGSSITAVRNGQSVDTSMGFSPLEGVLMATRVGNIDAEAIIHLAREKKFSLDDLEEYLNSKCGLLGLSEKTDSVQILLELEEKGDEEASRALDIFAYQVKKYIGSYIAVLGGLDLLVFTATIGERSTVMREKVTSELKGLGIVLDKKKNNSTIAKDGLIGNEGAPVKIMVITTDEMKEMASLTKEMLNE